MGFGNIGLLIGMALGLVPIIIHLINRRRAKLRRFAAIEFLLMSDKRLARRLKIKQILVLALRVLLIAALAFALAKPYLEPEVAAGPSVSEPGAVVLLIDDSASMQARDGAQAGDSRLESALAMGRSIIESGGPRTSFAVIATGAPARLLTPGLTYDHQVATRALEKIGAGARGPDLEGALKEAGRVLSESGERQRRIIALSDLAGHAWKPLSGWSWVPVTSFERPVLSATEPDNLAVMDVQAGDPGAPDEAGKVAMEVVAKVHNFGGSERRATVNLKLGSATVAEVVNVPANSEREVVFKLELEAGSRQGVVELGAVEGNALGLDDSFYFTVGARKAVSALIVNGAPSGTSYLDELFFLRAALMVVAPGESPVVPTIISPDELTSPKMAASDVVILANVGTLSREQVVALEQFVDKGGGLFITVGDKWAGEPGRMAELNRMYGRLLPYPVRELKSVGQLEDPRAVLSALSLSTVNFEHPVFEIFDGLEDASLFKARVLSHLLLDTNGQAEAQVLASLTGGIPAVVEAPLGRGRVMMWTTSVDIDWADLALRTSFPPLMQRLCAYLARALEGEKGIGFMVGEETRAPIPEGRGPLVLVGPDGSETPLEIPEEDAESIFIGAPEIAGHWLVMRAGERERGLSFAVNVDRRESDLRPAPESALNELAGVMMRDNGVLPAMDVASEASQTGDGSEQGRTMLWPWILAGLFLLFGSEAWLLVRNT